MHGEERGESKRGHVGMHGDEVAENEEVCGQMDENEENLGYSCN